MRSAIANFLRRLADRLRPRPSSEQQTPVEFMTSQELFDELKKRNDICLLYLARVQNLEEGRVMIHGISGWKIPAVFIPAAFNRLFNDVMSSEKTE